ncbi:MAG: tetraacyldisaccharide 4'-kinase, partial [Methylophilaceae bacterium]
GRKVILVTGIANTKALTTYVASHFELAKHFMYADHHQYTIADIEKIELAVQDAQADVVLTTEKDWVKLKSADLMASMSTKRWFYLPIETTFINCGSEFDAMVELLVEKRLRELESTSEG